MCDGGIGSGSVKGKNATNWRGGVWANMEAKRKKAPPGMLVGHKKPIPRDEWGNPATPSPARSRASNLKYVTRSENARGPSNRVRNRR